MQNGVKIIEAVIVPRTNSKAICSGCNHEAPLYDKKKTPRRFQFIPILGFPVYFIYYMRRVDCFHCNSIIIEKVPWADGKKTLTNIFMQFLANWAKHLSWKKTAQQFHVSWEKVFRSVEHIVNFGLKNRILTEIEAIGVDEILWHLGHKYLTLVYQINAGCVRLLWIAEDRTEKSLKSFFEYLGEAKCNTIKYVCSDMWKPYIKVIKEWLKNVVHILDRFHIVAMLNKAIDVIRADEYRKMTKDGYEPILKNSRWCLLKREENLTEKQEAKLSDLLKYNLKSIRAYLLVADFQGFWEYISPGWAAKFLKRWITRVNRSKLDPLKKVAKTLGRHSELILNWFKAKKAFSSGIVEGLNNKVKVTMRKSYGFRTYKAAEIALYHTLGALPEPKMTHLFY